MLCWITDLKFTLLNNKQKGVENKGMYLAYVDSV